MPNVTILRHAAQLAGVTAPGETVRRDDCMRSLGVIQDAAVIRLAAVIRAAIAFVLQ